LRKVSIADIPVEKTSHPDLHGAKVRQVINRNTVGSHRGMLTMTDFEPGGAHKLHRHPNSEQVSYLLRGTAQHLTASGPVDISAGDAVYVPPNEWHGFQNNGADTAVLLSLYSRAAAPGEPGYDSFGDGALAKGEPSVRKVSLSALRGDAALDEKAGFLGLGVYWLATRDTVGADGVVLGASTFEPGGLHEHHRHPHGDEILFILEGGGEHLTPDGAVSLSAGEIAYIPANEFHGFRNKPGVLTRTLFGYFGPGTLGEAGYETRASAS
jgi:quercetin dioxygenase-like cupin family protein